MFSTYETQSRAPLRDALVDSVHVRGRNVTHAVHDVWVDGVERGNVGSTLRGRPVGLTVNMQKAPYQRNGRGLDVIVVGRRGWARQGAT